MPVTRSFSRLRYATASCLQLFTGAAAWAEADLILTKSVAPSTPGPGEPVEFEIVVTNSGPDEAAEIHVAEQLPPGLAMPNGTAAFVSQGFYDADTGNWSVGNLTAGTAATMVLPAQIVDPAPPPCIVNIASIAARSDDPVTANNAAAAGVRQPGIDRCVDLAFDNTLFSVPEPFCNDQTRASLDVFISNRGPDTAQSVTVTLSQTPQRLPNFRFFDNDCANAPSARCDVGTIEAGAVKVLSIVSDDFNNPAAYSVTIALESSSAETDYMAGDNAISLLREVPATVVPPCDIPLPGIGAAPACFIATAAWGHPWNHNVIALRRFRDRRLLTNPPGRAFVSCYYRHSPPVAAYIAKRPALRAVTRAVLTPVVTAIRHPSWTSLATTVTLMLAAWSL